MGSAPARCPLCASPSPGTGREPLSRQRCAQRISTPARDTHKVTLSSISFLFLFFLFFPIEFSKNEKPSAYGRARLGARSAPGTRGSCSPADPARPIPGAPGTGARGEPRRVRPGPPAPGKLLAASRRSIVSGTAKKRQESTAARAVSFFLFYLNSQRQSNFIFFLFCFHFNKKIEFEFGGHFPVSIKPLKRWLYFNGKLLDSVPLT